MIIWPKSVKYLPLHQEDGHEPIPTASTRPARQHVASFVLPLFTHLGFFLAGVALTNLLLRTTLLVDIRGSPMGLTTNLYSELPAHLLTFSEKVQRNGTFDFPSIYRGFSPEVDQAWNDLEIGLLDIEVTSHDIEALGYDPSTMAHWPDDEGGSYMVTFESSHLLHCVDYIRKVTYWHYDYYLQRQDDESFRHPKQMERHADHCLEMLRQTLMCSADTTLLFFRWVAERDEPWPDFNTVHQCRDFESLQAWSKAHQRVNQTVPMKPPGATYLEIPP